MSGENGVTRRSVLLGAAGAVAAGALGGAASAFAGGSSPPLWKTALQRGLIYGSSWSTRLADDTDYGALINREAAILFTEDDLLWYQLKPTPESDLDFSFGDRFIATAERQRQLVFGAHLVWDEGFGDGWTEDDLFGMDEQTARTVLFGTVKAVVKRYRGRVVAWSCVNEAVDAAEADGLRKDVPWYQTIGPEYVAQSFRVAHAADPDACLVLNEFGFETDDEFDTAADKRSAALRVIDALLAQHVPVHALGVQAHLRAADFAAGKFDPHGYKRFLNDVADRGLAVIITELDVLDDGLPAANGPRDRGVADAYKRYLDAALQVPAVGSVMTFGLSDRYTWLQEDYPRDDGAPRRPLPYDDQLRPKPAYDALSTELSQAVRRHQLWRTRRS
ncbi:MAG: endo,4-beta-xylanase [Solirubrobacteraceae bacterium]